MHLDAGGLLWMFAYVPLGCSNNLRAWALRCESLIVSGTQLLTWDKYVLYGFVRCFFVF
uniref:Uncharacterized protein n=1 Tax=Setaria italica TaxID=4555 RepID=K3ZYX0_SETIT